MYGHQLKITECMTALQETHEKNRLRQTFGCMELLKMGAAQVDMQPLMRSKQWPFWHWKVHHTLGWTCAHACHSMCNLPYSAGCQSLLCITALYKCLVCLLNAKLRLIWLHCKISLLCNKFIMIQPWSDDDSKKSGIYHLLTYQSFLQQAEHTEQWCSCFRSFWWCWAKTCQQQLKWCSSGNGGSDRSRADLDASLLLPPGFLKTCSKACCIVLICRCHA